MEYGKFIVLDKTQYLPFIAAVNKCVSDDITRHFMNQMFFTEGKLISTDGHRLATYECDYLKSVLKEGRHYKVLKVAKKHIWIVEVSDCGDFPNYKRILPEDEPEKVLPFRTSKRPGERSVELAKLLTGFPEPTALNLDFLNDLPLDREYAVKWYDSRHAVVFEMGDPLGIGKYTELIMPLQMD